MPARLVGGKGPTSEILDHMDEFGDEHMAFGRSRMGGQTFVLTYGDLCPDGFELPPRSYTWLREASLALASTAFSADYVERLRHCGDLCSILYATSSHIDALLGYVIFTSVGRVQRWRTCGGSPLGPDRRERRAEEMRDRHLAYQLRPRFVRARRLLLDGLDL